MKKTKNIYGIFLRKFPKIIILIWILQFYFGKNQKYLCKLFYTMKKPLKNRAYGIHRSKNEYVPNYIDLKVVLTKKNI